MQLLGIRLVDIYKICGEYTVTYDRIFDIELTIVLAIVRRTSF